MTPSKKQKTILKNISVIFLLLSFIIYPIAPAFAEDVAPSAPVSTESPVVSDTTPTDISTTPSDTSLTDITPTTDITGESILPSSLSTDPATLEVDSALTKTDDKSLQTQALTMGASSNSSLLPTSPVSTSPIKQLVPTPDPTTGALLYNYPLTIPQGRNGMSPDLKLQYNSQKVDTDSVLGYGWSTNIPYITRVNKKGVNTLYTDNYFSSSLSGDLLLSSGTSYVSKVENGDFLNYTYSNNTWTATDKKGTVYKFGMTSATRQDDPNDSTKIAKWMLEEVRDTNNNYITYTYYKNGGQIYPNVITYTNNGSATGIYEIDFLRQSRSDVIKSYSLGFLETTNYRINEVDIKASSSIVHKYVLAYTTGDNSNRSILNTITESGTDEITSTTTTLPAFTITNAKTTSAGWTYNGNWALPSGIYFDGSSMWGDVNGDGLPDILTSWENGGGNPVWTRSVYINNGDGTFTLSTNFQIPVQFVINFANQNYIVQDINGDGLADIFKSNLEYVGGYYQTVSEVYLNNGSGWTLSSWTLPCSLYGYGSPIGVISDLNGDNLPDLYVSQFSHNQRAVYLNNGDGTWTDVSSNWTFPYVSNDGNTTYIDLNGDGITDILYIQYNLVNHTTTATAYLGDGKGTYTQNTEYGNISPLSSFGSSSLTDLGVRYGDINGDGLVDAVQSINWFGTLYKTSFINNGNGWTQNNNWLAPLGFTDGFFSLLSGLIDLDGDGLPDVTTNNSGNYLNNNSTNKADLISNITFPQGGTIAFTYKSAVSYRDSSNNVSNYIPYPIQTLNQVVVGGGTTTYSYYNGYYYYNANDLPNRKFLSFGIIKASGPVNNITKTYYHKGNGTDTTNGEYNDDISKAGKPYRVENTDASGNLYSVLVNKWDKSNLGVNNFVKLVRSTTLTYDGGSTHRDTAEEYTNENTYGNLTQKISWGEVSANNDGTFTDTGTDKSTENISYATNTGNNVVGLPSEDSLLDQSSNKVKESKYYYDTLALGSVGAGNQTKVEQWKSDTTYINSQKAYNTTYGIVSSSTDPRGKTTSYSYDSYYLYPTTITDPLTHTSQYTYDYSSGKVKQTTEQNGFVYLNVYDGLDRLITEKIPDITTPTTLDTKAVYSYTDTSNAVSVHKTDYLDSSNSADTYQYFDGYGRLIQDRKEAETANSFNIRDVNYDSRGLTSFETIRYTSTGSAKTSLPSNQNLFISYYYDPIERLITVSNNVTIDQWSYSYNKWETTITNPNGKVKNYYKDALGNLVKVEELNSGNTYTTNYEWNLIGNLTKITDALSNVRNFTYDGLSRRLTAEDLHAVGDTSYGTRSYVYDDASNLTQTTNANGNIVNYTYDDVNRQLTENYTGQTGTETTYAYDSCTNGIGKLCTITMLSGTNTAYLYDSNGNTTRETKTINAVNYQTNYTYDRQGNTLVITYPDGINSQVRYTYNTAGLLNQVEEKEGSGSFTNVVSNIDYSPLDKITVINYANGTTTTNTYDVNKLYRMTNKVTTRSGPNLQTIAYTYDNVGNITQIADTAGVSISKTVNYTYDDLNRLTSATTTATGNSQNYSESYAYDALGNLTTKNGTTYLYEGNSGTNYANPHATTSVGGTTYSYDNDGNLTAYGNTANTFDYNDRLTQTVITRGGMRMAQSKSQGSPIETKGLASKGGGIIPMGGGGGGSVPTIVSATATNVTAYTATLNGVVNPNGNLTQAWFYMSSGSQYGLQWIGSGTSNVTLTPYTLTNLTPNTTYQFKVKAENQYGQAQSPSYTSFTTLDGPIITTPTITTLSPSSTVAGQSGMPITITGTNFVAGVSVALFNGSPRGTSVTNSTTLTMNLTSIDLAQTGTANISVTNGTGMTSGTLPFTITTNTGNTTITYDYDQAGQRVKYSNGTITTYYPNTLYNITGITKTKQIYAGDMLIATIETVGSTPTTYYNHTDHLNSTSVVSNSAGTSAQLLDYYPYGSQRISSGTWSEQRQYIGQMYDVDSTLSYLNARYYDSGRGQFVSEDPMFWATSQDWLLDPTNQNSYSYSRDNPINLSDPSGKNPYLISAGVAFVGSLAFDAGKDIYQNVQDYREGKLPLYLVTQARGEDPASRYIKDTATAVAFAVVATRAGIFAEKLVANGTISQTTGKIIATTSGGLVNATSNIINGNSKDSNTGKINWAKAVNDFAIGTATTYVSQQIPNPAGAPPSTFLGSLGGARVAVAHIRSAVSQATKAMAGYVGSLFSNSLNKKNK
ncbi:MAG: FG-GAP-like repeat-containing protein [Bacteroidales bacterium]|jgi:RHS repeat-associated protein